MTKDNDFFKPKITSKNYFFLFAVLTGILVGTSYIPLPAWALSFCYIPLWYATLQAEKQNLSLKYIFTLGWVSQFILTFIGFYWIYYTGTEFGDLPPTLAAASLILFCSFMHIYIPTSLVLSVWLKRKKNISATALLFLLATSLILLERIWPSIFEWNLGYTLLWMKWPLFQWADTVGFWGLSAFILFTQACILFLILQLKTNKIKSCIGFASLLILIFILHFGALQKEKLWSKTDDVFNVMVTQGNIANEEKLASEKGSGFQPFVLQTYIDLVQNELNKSTQKPDALLWPETSMPFALDRAYSTRPNQQKLQNQIQLWNTILLTGGYSQDTFQKDHLGNYKIRNSIFFLGPHLDDGQMLQLPTPYFKSDLLVFGEYMPFGQDFPILYKWLPFVGVYEKGPGPVLKTITTAENKKINLGPQICYESLNPKFSQGLALAGADLIFNATNDSWYGDQTEPFQHLTMTLARGIEVRRPLIRATNTGISTVILANGQTLEQSKMNQAWAHTYSVPYLKSAPQSFYTHYGHYDFLFWILVFIFIVFFRKATPDVRH